MVRINFLAITLLLLSQYVNAEVLFEGYYKVLINNQHRGYSIQKYEFDSKNKKFKATTFLKLDEVTPGTGFTESIKATATEQLKPISYEYTSIDGKKTKLIDAKLKGNKLVGTIQEGKTKKSFKNDIPGAAFNSTFLVYVMLQSKDGLKPESNYKYQAIAEETGNVVTGSALVNKLEQYNGVTTFKILNTFGDQKFLSYVSNKGEVLGTDALENPIKTELVASPDEAIGNFPKSEKVIKLLFGDLPKGEQNIITLNKKVATESITPSKTEGVEAGKGIQIKAEENK